MIPGDPSKIFECDKFEKEYAELFALVRDSMQWGHVKVNRWFHTANPHLGNVVPCHMIVIGRGYKLRKWIETTIEENTVEVKDE